MALKEKDPVSGMGLTGHDWDGIKELDTPVPWAARWALWISIVTAALFWVFYPSFPGLRDYAKGLLGYSSRGEVNAALAQAEAGRAVASRLWTWPSRRARAASSRSARRSREGRGTSRPRTRPPSSVSS